MLWTVDGDVLIERNALLTSLRLDKYRAVLAEQEVDMEALLREATEGFYPDRNMHQGIGEFMPTEDLAMSVRKITAKACERIARQAFLLFTFRSS